MKGMIMTVSAYPNFETHVDIFGPDVGGTPEIVVAIPARNEEQRIGPCLDSLIGQIGIDQRKAAVVVMLNNCTDGTLDAIAAMTARLPFPVVAASTHLPVGFANAGWARRLAMQHAASMMGDNGLLLTTDADCTAYPDWMVQNQRESSGDIDAVAGYVTADWSELSRFPEAVLAQGALEWEYQGLATELEAKADPQIHDPWPRHNQNCGASLAIKAGTYRAIGGIPPIAVGEDRALCDAVRAIDGKIRHSLAAHVTASARTDGRASGGMADALKARGTDAYFCDEILEPAIDTLRRNRWRARARAAWHSGRLEAWLTTNRIAMPRAIADLPTFGLVWAMLENGEPRLARKRLRSNDLPLEICRIQRMLGHASRSGRRAA